MRDIRIFIASSKELEVERNYLAFLVLAKEDEFAARGLRVRLAKWEYVDPKMTEARTEDRYLDEMYNCDAALVLFRDIAGMYTREELDKALAREQTGSSRLKTHQILFAADGKPGSDSARLRESMPPDSYGVWSGMDELRDAFLSLVDKVAQNEGLVDAPSDKYVRKITAFLAADEELAKERNAFADTVLNVNDLLEQAHRNIRVRLKFYDPANAESVIESSEMGLVLYGTNYRMFGGEEIKRVYERVADGTQNPKRFYVFFRDLDEAAEKSLDEAFKTFRSDFVSKLGHFTCQFGDANALRLGFLLSLERYAGESIEIYSTVSAPTTPVFVGRENELRRLCELLEPVPGKFPAGRLPVITGAGGTGKSELVRQYASQLRVQYPGGVFLVDMEHVKTWDEAFLGILKGTPNNGIKVEECLGLKDGGGSGETPKEPMTGEKVRDALLRRAREAGPVLLVLDNVEGCMALLGRDGGFRKAFPAGFSERVRVNVVATARVCDVMLRDADWAVPFPLGDLSQDAALEVLLADRPEADAAERKAAGRVAELLGYRALYLRRVPALIGDLYAQTVCDSYAELAKALEENLLETVAEETEGTHLPDVLWKMTRERLLKMPFGAECVKLAQVASFFSPEGFPRHILKHLWKTVVAPNLDEKKFERAFAILRHHNVFQSEAPIHIHRLDRAAILQTANAEPGLAESVGKALAMYDGMTPRFWSLLADNIVILHFVPDVARSSFWHWFNDDGDCISIEALLLCRNALFQSECRWSHLRHCDWAELLMARPQFSDHCPWEILWGSDWTKLLKHQPQFADHCLWEKLEGQDWSKLLAAQPQLAKRCVWEKMNGTDWKNLLVVQPRFADKCLWVKMDGRNWADLLGEQPQFADKCLWVKMDGWNWADLLGEQPQFADRCPWEKLDGGDWTRLLEEQPQFADRCPWEKLDGGNWADLLEEQPLFADRCPWEKLDGGNWANLLDKQPQFADRCPWEELDGGNWADLLEEQPQFADRCPWEKLDGGNWANLLDKQPRFADWCPWEKLDGGNWVNLLEERPQLADRCPWEKLDGGNWADLLGGQPQFADRCPWEKLNGTNWGCLLRKQPQFADRCPWEKIYGETWAWTLLKWQPQLADHCQWEKLDAIHWEEVLDWQPQFADYVPKGMSDCLGRWSCRPLLSWEKVLLAHPEAVDHCPWNKLFGNDWVEILINLPQFADRCPWEKLDGGNWVNLLEAQPQFADRCPWEKLDGGNWVNLLEAQPQFADRCPWEKLDGGNWATLISKQPQFADKCQCWEEIDDDNALRLIQEQPELSVHFSKTHLQKLEDMRQSMDKGLDDVMMSLDDALEDMRQSMDTGLDDVDIMPMEGST